MKLPWYVLPVVAFVAGLLLGWKGCERETKIVTKTVTKTDTIRVTETPDPVVIDNPYPVYITKYIPTEPDPPDFNLDQMRTYIDTAVFDGLSLGYEIKTRGELKGAIFRPTFERETIIKEITTTNTIDNTKPLRGLYLGVTIGGNKSEFGTLAPGAYYVAPRVIVGYNYNVIEGGHNVTVGRKLF